MHKIFVKRKNVFKLKAIKNIKWWETNRRKPKYWWPWHALLHTRMWNLSVWQKHQQNKYWIILISSQLFTNLGITKYTSLEEKVGNGFTITKSTRVCELHFKPDEIKTTLGRGIKTLKTGAEVPSVYSFKKQNKTKQTRRSPRKRRLSSDTNTNKLRRSPRKKNLL